MCFGEINNLIYIPDAFLLEIAFTKVISPDVHSLFNSICVLEPPLPPFPMNIYYQPNQQGEHAACNISLCPIHVVTYQLLLKDPCQENAQAYRELMKAQVLKSISPGLLFTTGLYEDLEQEALVKKRFEALERLTGIELEGV